MVPKENSLALLTELPYKPLALAFDTEDNLLVVIEYSRPKELRSAENLKYIQTGGFKGTSHGYWYSVNSTAKVFHRSKQA